MHCVKIPLSTKPDGGGDSIALMWKQMRGPHPGVRSRAIGQVAHQVPSGFGEVPPSYVRYKSLAECLVGASCSLERFNNHFQNKKT